MWTEFWESTELHVEGVMCDRISLCSFAPVLKGSHVKWFTDSQAAARIVEVGSMKLDFQPPPPPLQNQTHIWHQAWESIRVSLVEDKSSNHCAMFPPLQIHAHNIIHTQTHTIVLVAEPVLNLPANPEQRQDEITATKPSRGFWETFNSSTDSEGFGCTWRQVGWLELNNGNTNKKHNKWYPLELWKTLAQHEDRKQCCGKNLQLVGHFEKKKVSNNVHTSFLMAKMIALTLWRPNRLSILLCLTPDGFNRQWEPLEVNGLKGRANWLNSPFRVAACLSSKWVLVHNHSNGNEVRILMQMKVISLFSRWAPRLTLKPRQTATHKWPIPFFAFPFLHSLHLQLEPMFWSMASKCCPLNHLTTHYLDQEVLQLHLT